MGNPVFGKSSRVYGTHILFSSKYSLQKQDKFIVLAFTSYLLCIDLRACFLDVFCDRMVMMLDFFFVLYVFD